jgi:hypothetical protein
MPELSTSVEKTLTRSRTPLVVRAGEDRILPAENEEVAQWACSRTIVLVTGVARGCRQVLAEAFSAEGAKLVGCDTDS